MCLYVVIFILKINRYFSGMSLFTINMHLCLFSQIQKCLCMYVWVDICVFMCVPVCMYACVYLCPCLCVCVCVCVCVRVYVYMCVCVCVCVCRYLYLCVCIHLSQLFNTFSFGLFSVCCWLFPAAGFMFVDLTLTKISIRPGCVLTHADKNSNITTFRCLSWKNINHGNIQLI